MAAENEKPGGVKQQNRANEERRVLIRSIAAGGGLTVLALAGLLPVRSGMTAARLRPPGAIDEHDFLAACIKCGQCVQVCPVDAIKLADATDGAGIGTPYIAARDQACDFSCDATQCILACPTEALTHRLVKKEEVTMGKARLSRPDACLARKGQGVHGKPRGESYSGYLRYEKIDRWVPQRVADQTYHADVCDLCVTSCPIKGAISLEPVAGAPEPKAMTPVVHDACVGCGVCEMICPTNAPSIVVDVQTGPRGLRRMA